MEARDNISLTPTHPLLPSSGCNSHTLNTLPRSLWRLSWSWLRISRSSPLPFILRTLVSYFCLIWCACSVVSNSVTAWIVVHQVPPSVEFSRKEYCSELPFPPPEDLPDPVIEPTSLESLALAGGLFTTGATWEATYKHISDLWFLSVLLKFKFTIKIATISPSLFVVRSPALAK